MEGEPAKKKRKTHQVQMDEDWDEVCESFDGMELHEELLRGIYAYGFEKVSELYE